MVQAHVDIVNRGLRGRHIGGTPARAAPRLGRGCGSAGWRPSREREARCSSQWPDELVVGRLPHQLDSSGRVGGVERLGGDVGHGLPEQYQSRSWPPGAPAAAVVLRDRDLEVVGAVGQLDVAVGAPDRQLPADVGLGLRGARGRCASPAVQGAAVARRGSRGGWGRRRPSPSCTTRRSCAPRPRPWSTQCFLRTARPPPVLAGWNCHFSGVSSPTKRSTRFSSSASEKCAPSVQQPTSARRRRCPGSPRRRCIVARRQPRQVAAEHLVGRRPGR